MAFSILVIVNLVPIATAFSVVSNASPRFLVPKLSRRCTHRLWLQNDPLYEQIPHFRADVQLFSSTKEETEKETENVTPPAIVTGISDGTDLSVVGKEVTDKIYKDALVQTAGWVAAACGFGFFVWTAYGSEAGEEFFAGYLVEQSLSVDNLFVFLLLFEYFKVPLPYQNRVLNWGIFGAMGMRAIMIGVGAVALKEFHAILLVFAGILIFSSVKLLVGGDDDDEDMSENAIVKYSKSFIASTENYDEDRFFTIENGVKVATPLFICMIAVEISDVVFAVDSVPAVFGVTENPLIVYTSNIFAIMGLRSLYTILSQAAQDLKYLEPAVAVVLGFIGSKMIAEYFGVCVPTNISLAVVVSLLTAGVGFSILEKGDE